MDYQELIERLRKGFGTAAGRATQMNFYHKWCQKAADAIESLLVENERLKHNLQSTEQTMREYQELATERLGAIAKYRDAPCVAYATTNEEDDLTMLFFDAAEARKYSGDDEPIKLIVKPGENK